MLNLDHISKRYAVGGDFLKPRHVTALDDFSLHVEAGEFFSLVGESGCGKSTLARIVCGLDTLDAGRMTIGGTVIETPRAFRDTRLRRQVQMVFQDPYSSLNPRMRMRDILEEPLKSFGWGDRAAVARRVAELLEIIRFPADALDRYPHQFSGGQRQRIAVARALAAKPALLICDEPVSALDVSIKGQIVNLLIDINRQFGVTILFISHDLSLVERISHRVGVMYLGRLVELGTAREVFSDPRHPYTRLLIASIPSADPTQRHESPPAGELPSPFALPSGCHFRDRCGFAVDRCAIESPAFAKAWADRDHYAACHLRAELPAIQRQLQARRTIPMMEIYANRSEGVGATTTGEEI